jgi:hypothetical protein
LEEDSAVRPYLTDLLERMGDKTKYTSSEDSTSWAAYREAEKLTDISMVGELAAAVAAGLPTDTRRSCYFTIGKVGANLGAEDCAALLLSLLPGETNKYNLNTLLHGIGQISKGPNFDLSPVFPLLADSRWMVRQAAINALDKSANPETETRVIDHLAATTDPYEQTYCHAVLSTIGTLRSLPVIEANLKSRKRDVKASAQWAANAIRVRNGL